MGTLYHLKVGCGDTSIIDNKSDTFMIDCYKIDQHVNLLPRNKMIKALFITHQHYDHFLGMKYLKENGYSIENLVYSPYTRRIGDSSVAYDEWKDFAKFKDYFINKGATVHTPYRQASFDSPWGHLNGIKFYILGPNKSIAESDTRELHDASLVFKVDMGARKCCFTGDASDTNLNWVAYNTNNYCDDILHASHHGSINGADLDFIKKAKARYTVISTESGVHESVPHSTALQRYQANTEEKVYRTDTFGSVKWTF